MTFSGNQTILLEEQSLLTDIKTVNIPDFQILKQLKKIYIY